MRRACFVLALLLIVIGINAQNVGMLKVRELTLSNGMTVWLNEDHSQPKVFGAVVVNAGAKDCPNTGIAHYFEHIMFKGTQEIGTVDYAKEKPWLDSIAACYDLLAATTDDAKRAKIQQDINLLSQKAADYAIPNEFNTLISRYGGSSLNAGTSYDFTFYHNVFTPQYIEQWCRLNSDRFVNPVFRLFQGELETVYEEKNLYSDNIMSTALEKVTAELFGTQPYAYPVIGSTENLKNPKLSDMKAFYEKYYVGSNMGLVLCGDFDAETITPLLEKTFGRLPKGVKPVRGVSPLPDITAERTVEVKLPIPLVSAEALVFKAPTDYDKDANALKVALQMLSNGKAGMLDSLTNEGKMLMSAATTFSLNDAGAAAMIVIPNLLAKTAKAEAASLQQVQRLMAGDFSDESLLVQKQEIYRENARSLETIEERAMTMVEVMSSGHSWREYIENVEAVNSVTKDDVTAVAKRYLSAPFVRFSKKYGKYPKDRLTQPGYKPVVPANRGQESEYAKQLAQIPVREVSPRLIDFDKDASISKLGDEAVLYTVKNPVNELFNLSVKWNRGTLADPRLDAVDALLNNIGTDSLTRQQLGNALQTLGADMSFSVDKSSFSLEVTGIDKNFKPTMQLISHFIGNMKADEKSVKKVVDGAKTNEKSLTESNTDVLKAMLEYAAYGNRASTLHRTTAKEVKAMGGDAMIDAFRKVTSSACDIIYSGSLSNDEVRAIVGNTLPVEQSRQAYVDYSYDPMPYSSPVVYVFNKPDARQTLFFTYEQVSPLTTVQERIPATLFDQYLGGGMSSVMFQEVREFRSMAYSTGSRIMSRSLKRHASSPLAQITIVGTQADKTMGAISLVDSLLRDMPMDEKNFLTARQECVNEIYNEFPSFREIGAEIAAQRRQGYTEDSKTGWSELLRKATADDMRRFYESHIKANASHRALCIVGNKKKLNLKELSKYGKVVFLKEKDLFRK